MNDTQVTQRGGSVALPYLVVFLASMGVMIVELAASRLVSKYFGTSLYTWTTIIGVILGGISLGNYVGGCLADRFAPATLAPALLLVSSVTVFAILLLDPLLGRILHGVGASVVTAEMVLRAVLAIVGLFLLPSAALGTISPTMAKMVLTASPKMGNAVGAVYALGSIGSIVGTFLSGFVLIPLLGVRSIVFVVGGIVGLLALALSRNRIPALVWIVLMIGIFVVLFVLRGNETAIFARYSPYSYIEIRDQEEAGRAERVLIMDGLIHNRYDPSRPDDLLYEYEKTFSALTRVVAGRSPGQPLSTLTLGGGAFLFPAYLERHYPGVHEVVEIDPEVVLAARRFFDLPVDSALRIRVTDARNFVNWAQGRRSYDIVYLDCFNSYSVPAHLTTREFLSSVSALISPDGRMACNVIDVFSLGGFLGSFVLTMREVFPRVEVYETTGTNRNIRGTFVVVGSRGPELPAVLGDARYSATRISLWDLTKLIARTRSHALTDDHAPVENLVAPVFLHSVR